MYRVIKETAVYTTEIVEVETEEEALRIEAEFETEKVPDNVSHVANIIHHRD